MTRPPTATHAPVRDDPRAAPIARATGAAASAAAAYTRWSHSAGGPTSVANGRLLCSFHHHKAHSAGFSLERLPSGQVRFHRRT